MSFPFLYYPILYKVLTQKVDGKHLTFNEVLEKHSKGENSIVAQGADKSRGRE